MKHKNISVWSILLPLLFLLVSCRDEMPGKGGVSLEVEEGIPGILTLSVSSGNPALHVVTRATEEEEKHISSLYVFIIDMTTAGDPANHPILSRKWFPGYSEVVSGWFRTLAG